MTELRTLLQATTYLRFIGVQAPVDVTSELCEEAYDFLMHNVEPKDRDSPERIASLVRTSMGEIDALFRATNGASESASPPPATIHNDAAQIDAFLRYCGLRESREMPVWSTAARVVHAVDAQKRSDPREVAKAAIGLHHRMFPLDHLAAAALRSAERSGDAVELLAATCAQENPRKRVRIDAGAAGGTSNQFGKKRIYARPLMSQEQAAALNGRRRPFSTVDHGTAVLSMETHKLPTQLRHGVLKNLENQVVTSRRVIQMAAFGEDTQARAADVAEVANDDELTGTEKEAMIADLLLRGGSLRVDRSGGRRRTRSTSK